MKHMCPYCFGCNTTRMQWVDNRWFEYWTCWDCNGSFTVNKE